MQETEYVKKPVFRANFWKDFKAVLGRHHDITQLEGCDFSPIYTHVMAEREAKKKLTKEVCMPSDSRA